MACSLVTLLACGDSSTSDPLDASARDESDAGSEGGVEVSIPDEALPSVPFRSGTRLRARVIDGGDGALLFAGWFDTELQADCRFFIGVDGWAYCVPEAKPESFGPLFCGYLDASCSTAVASGVPNLTPDLVRIGGSYPFGGSGRCSSARVSDFGTFFRVTGISQTVDASFELDQDQCRPAVPSAPGPTCMTFDQPSRALLLERLSLDAFVSAEVKQDPGALRVRWLMASDGAYEAQTLIGEDDQECDLHVTPEGDSICLTVHTAEVTISDGYSDASCEHGGVYEIDELCGGSQIALVPSSECPFTRGGSPARSLLYAWSTSPVEAYERSFETGACEPVGNFAFEPQLGQALPSQAFPALEVGELGTGRLRARFGRGSAGRVVRNRGGAHGIANDGSVTEINDQSLKANTPDGHRRTYWFYDTERSEVCAPVPTPSGERCLPAGSNRGDGGSLAFFDAACSEPAIVVEQGCPEGRGGGGAFPVFVLAYESFEELVTQVLFPISDQPRRALYREVAGPGSACSAIPSSVVVEALPAERVLVDAYAPVTTRIE